MAENVEDFEGEPCGTILFHVVDSRGNLQIREVESVLLRSILIGGHKQDLSELFGAQDNVQMWVYQGTRLDDDKSLWDYGLDGTDTAIINVTVS